MIDRLAQTVGILLLASIVVFSTDSVGYKKPFKGYKSNKNIIS